MASMDPFTHFDFKNPNGLAAVECNVPKQLLLENDEREERISKLASELKKLL